MRQDMLDQVILYLFSTLAQVWSAFLIFHVLLIRDRRSATAHEIQALWQRAQFWWPPLIKDLLTRANNPSGGFSLQPYGLTVDTLIFADTDQKSFRTFLDAIDQHKIVSLWNINYQSQVTFLSGQNYQKKFEPIARDVRALTASLQDAPKTINGFKVDMVSVLVNVSTLAFHALLRTFCESSFLLGIGILANLYIGYLFTAQISKTLKVGI